MLACRYEKIPGKLIAVTTNWKLLFKNVVLIWTAKEHLLKDILEAISEQFLGNEMRLYQNSGSY